MDVASASFRGMRKQDDRAVAEVEVRSAQPGEPGLLVHFRKGPKGYQLVRVLQNDADRETDWFDNDLHAAFQDVTAQMFDGPCHGGGIDRASFAEQVLGTDDVKAQLDRHWPN